MKDLFGNEVEEPDEYTAYIASAKWASKRKAKLEQVGYKCERCGRSRHSVDLDVHHLTYDRLGAERMGDLEVLCKDCHIEADAERVETAKQSKKETSLVKGFQRWLQKNGKWLTDPRLGSNEIFQEKKRFLRQLYRERGVAYSLDFTVLGREDPNPKWTPDDDAHSTFREVE